MMLLSLGTCCYCFFVLSLLFAKHHANAAVISVEKEFLTDAECNNLRLQHQPHVPIPSSAAAAAGSSLGRSRISIQPKIYNRLLESLIGPTSATGDKIKNDTAAVCFAEQQEGSSKDEDDENHNHVFLSKVVSTTALHRDHHVEYKKKRGQVVRPEERVAFVFLDDQPVNDGYYFSHVDEKVQIEKGKLVVFDGSEPHHTVLPPPSSPVAPVHLLGPFSAVNGRLALVGFCNDCILVRLKEDINGNGVYDPAVDLGVANVTCKLRQEPSEDLLASDVSDEDGECFFDDFPSVGTFPLSIKFEEIPSGKKFVVPDEDPEDLVVVKESGSVVVFENTSSPDNSIFYTVFIEDIPDDPGPCSGWVQCFIYYVLFGWLLDLLGLWSP